MKIRLPPPKKPDPLWQDRHKPAGAHQNKKKEQNKKACRLKLEDEK